MENVETQVKKHPFTKSFSSETLELLVAQTRLVQFEPRQLILAYQQPAEKFWMLTKGRAVLRNHIPGSRKQTIETVSAPAVVGWSWLLEPYRWHFDVTARGPVSAIEVNAKVLREQMKSDSKLASELYPKFFELVVERLQASRLQSLDIYKSSDHRGLHEVSNM